MVTDNSLSKSALIVQQALLAKGLTFTVVELSQSTRTAQEAAQTIGCQVEQIIKSLLFRGKATSQPILLLVSGGNRVNEKALAKELTENIVKADADFTREVTGFAIGGVPPTGHKQVIKTYIDEDLLKYETLWAAAGTPNAVFRLQSKDLIQITNGKLINVK